MDIMKRIPVIKHLIVFICASIHIQLQVIILNNKDSFKSNPNHKPFTVAFDF